MGEVVWCVEGVGGEGVAVGFVGWFGGVGGVGAELGFSRKFYLRSLLDMWEGS